MDMAGLKGRSGPPGNANGFIHGLSMIQDKRREGRLPRGLDKRFKLELLNQLIEDKGGSGHTTAATRLLAQTIATDATFLGQMNRAIERVLRQIPKYRENPAALSKLDSYRRPIINSLSANVERFGYDKRQPPPKTLDEILNEPEEEQESP
jgi:hypothetical protein